MWAGFCYKSGLSHKNPEFWNLLFGRWLEIFNRVTRCYDFYIIFQNGTVSFFVEPYVKRVERALFVLVSAVSLEKPFGLIQFTLKSSTGAGDNVGLTLQCFERQFYKLHLGKNVAYKTLLLLPLLLFSNTWVNTTCICIESSLATRTTPPNSTHLID